MADLKKAIASSIQQAQTTPEESREFFGSLPDETKNRIWAETQIFDDSPTKQPRTLINYDKFEEDGRAGEDYVRELQFGEALHLLKYIDPATYEDLYRTAMSEPEVQNWLRDSYERAKKSPEEGGYREKRSFDDFVRHSRLDQVIGGYITGGKDSNIPTMWDWDKNLPYGEQFRQKLDNLQDRMGFKENFNPFYNRKGKEAELRGMAKRRPSAGSSALNQVDKNYKYGGDSAIGALFLPERREILREEVQNQLIGYDDRGQQIRQTIPAQYGESEVDFSYSPIVRGAKATGSFLNDIFFGDANEQSEAAGRAVSAVRGVVGGLADYASDQYQAGMAGGTIYDPETRQITEFDPTAVMVSGAPAGIQAVRNAPPNTMTLGAAGGRMNPARNIDTEVSQAKAAYDLDPNNEELRQSYMALRRERDSVPSLPRIRRGRGSAIRVFHGSPYEFQNFSMSNIGTGEGAQAYGHGLYFAERPEIAKSYRYQLSQSGSSIGGRPIMDDYNSIIERAERLPPAAAQIEYDKAAFLEDLELTDDIAESIGRIENPEVAKWARSEVAPQFKPAGYSYEANLNVQPDDLLDWDAPLSQQNEKVRQLAAERLNLPEASSRSKQAYIDEKMSMSGGQFYNKLVSDLGRDNAASNVFNDANIKGIRYLDSTSRLLPDFYISSPDTTVSGKWMVKDINNPNSQGSHFDTEMAAKSYLDEIQSKPTRNYVMFDDSLIDTKRVNDKLTPSWMDQGARMQRAQDLEFDTGRVAYRGLSGEYDPNKAGNYQMFTSSPEDAGEYGSNVVSSYLRKGNNLVVDGGRNNFNSIPVRNLPDAVRANLHPSVGSVARTDDIAYAAQAAGYDSVSINNVFDKASNEIPLKPPSASNAPMNQEMMDFLDEVGASGMLNNTPDVALPPEIPKNYDPSTIDIIFDPKNIRSIEAEFDPTKADSADLLSSRQSERQMSALRGIA